MARGPPVDAPITSIEVRAALAATADVGGLDVTRAGRTRARRDDLGHELFAELVEAVGRERSGLVHDVERAVRPPQGSTWAGWARSYGGPGMP